MPAAGRLNLPHTSTSTGFQKSLVISMSIYARAHAACVETSSRLRLPIAEKSYNNPRSPQLDLI